MCTKIIFFLHSISVSEYLNPFRSVCILFLKPTELVFFCSLHKILHNVYFIIFTTPPPPSPKNDFWNVK